MIEVRIDELVLDRALELDPEAIRAATEAELARRPGPSAGRPHKPATTGVDVQDVAHELTRHIREAVRTR
jgi:hypothetical protein